MNPRTLMRGSLSGAVALLSVGVGWSLLQSQASTDRAVESNRKAEQAVAEVDSLSKTVQANSDALDQANAKLIALGKAPVPVPSPRPAPEPRPEGLTASQLEAVRAVVVEELDSHDAKVSQATINQITQAAGTLATQNLQAGLEASVKAAVVAYCTGDKCVGPTGPSGRAGDNGKDAPAVTDAQLLEAAKQALAAYCGQDSKPCMGPAGKDGERGPAGKDAAPAYSVVDQDCVGDGPDSFWRVYLSNGTDQKTVDAKGPCRIGPEN
jgi:hypothetical protein